MTGESEWFPLFDFQDWNYQSSLVLPTAEELESPAGASLTAKKWAKGVLYLGMALRNGSAFILSGRLSFSPGYDLEVDAKGTLGVGSSPATFEAIGTGTRGNTKGAIYQLLGWVFPEEPILNAAGRVLNIRGSVRAVRGSDASPEIELGKMPVGTVGSFVIARSEVMTL